MYYDNLSELSNKTGYVYQEQILFNDNLANNISLNFEKNKIDYSSQEIDKLYKSFENSNVNDFVSKSELFEFEVKESGSNLSAGQRQRIFIARALYKAEELLVLDEPTSNLDPDTEKKVIENILNNYAHLSVIISTHKYLILDQFDNVFSIKNGKLINTDV